nr:MAG TPA: hypothetical protein [Caudoviricetes sp.]
MAVVPMKSGLVPHRGRRETEQFKPFAFVLRPMHIVMYLT